MHLTPKETDRLMLFLAAELARRRRAAGLKLNVPEARALIADTVCEAARAGRSVPELMEIGGTVLTTDDVLPGVADMIDVLMVEPMLDDGQKLVCVHAPIRPGTQPVADDAPGRYRLADAPVEINAGRAALTLRVRSTGDRPIQVGSHFHFFEVNAALEFDRAAAYGFRLDIPAGTSMRFEPGEARDVPLVALGGTRTVHGLNRMTEGALDDPAVRRAALARVAPPAVDGAGD